MAVTGSGATAPVPLRIPGVPDRVSLHVHGETDRYISRRLREDGIWEPYETTLVLAALQPGDVFVDVGANIGYYPVIAAGRVGRDGAVFAFEPDPAAERRTIFDCSGKTCSLTGVRIASVPSRQAFRTRPCPGSYS